MRKHFLITVGKGGQVQLYGVDYSLAALRAALIDVLRQRKDVHVVVNSEREGSVQ